MTADRGVSEAVGFVLVFALVTATIGVVYGQGLAGLSDAQEAEQMENMERAFDVLDDNVDDIVRRDAESRSTEVKLVGGSLRVGDPVSLRFKTNSTQHVSCNTTGSLELSTRPIVYEDGDTQIVYSTGAVFRSDDDNPVMVSEPRWVTDGDQAVLPVVTMTEGDLTNMGGRSTILVTATRKSQTFRCEFDDAGADLRVNVTVDSPRAEAWKRYFEDRGYDVTNAGPDSVTAKFTTSQFYLPATRVEVAFEP